MLVTNVRGFLVPSSSVLKFEGPQKTWGWASDSRGQTVSRSYGKGRVSVPFRGLLTDAEGKFHWWGNRESNQILDVTSVIEAKLTFPVLDAQCVQYAYWWSHNHHFYRWKVGGHEISKYNVFFSDCAGNPIPDTNYVSQEEKIKLLEHEARALANT